MLGLLLLKDLRRARRNPVPYLIHLGLPLLLTGLLGILFAGGGDRGLGRIRFAVVDEDQSLPLRLLRGGLAQDRANGHLEPVFLGREEALRQVTNNLLSAALIVPTNFTSGYLAGRGGLTLALVKNPAQQYHPAILEELLSGLVAGLNALSRNFGSDLAAWHNLIEGGSASAWRDAGDLLAKTGEKADLVRRQLNPIPVTYETEARPSGAGGSGAKRTSRAGLFAFVLPGLSAMFLLFLADAAMRDLHREIRLRTLERLRTLPSNLREVLFSKVLFAQVIVAIGALILLGGGSSIFRFRWEHPLAVIVLAAGYGLFAGGLMAFLAGVWPGERKADVLNSLVAMALGFAGGCAFPAEVLPPLLRDHVVPYLPTGWFVEAMRGAQFGGAGAPAWPLAGAGMAVVGLALVGLASWQLRWRLERGWRE